MEWSGWFFVFVLDFLPSRSLVDPLLDAVLKVLDSPNNKVRYF